MNNKEFNNKISFLLVLLLLWNPITLWLLIKDAWYSIFISLAVIILNIFLFECSIRLRMWCFNISMILSIMWHTELVFRVNFQDKDIPNLYEIYKGYYFNKPLMNRYFETAEYNSLYKTNVQGYRIDEWSNETNIIERCDWLFIGDSFTQGAQVDYPELYTSQIFRDFNDKIILNAGISGAGICEELNLYKDKGVKLSPKKVFLQLGVFNDFFNVREREITYKDYLIELSSLYRYLEYQFSNDPILPLGRWTEPFMATDEGNKLYNILYKESSQQKEEDKSALKLYLHKLNELIKSNGAELIVILIPSKEQVSDQLLNEVTVAYNTQVEQLDMTYPNRWLSEVLSIEGVKFIDLYDDFRNSSQFPFFEIDEHMNRIGHTLIANRLRLELIDEISPYTFMSLNNYNDRYPTVAGDGSIVMHQSVYDDKYRIISNSNMFDSYQSVLHSDTELIHPMVSHDGAMLVYTEGNQDIGETEVVLVDTRNGQSTLITTDKYHYGAIPSFSNGGDKIVYADWRYKDGKMTIPKITIFDIMQKQSIELELGDEECWRPIFSRDDNSILYIQKDLSSGKFSIKSFNLLDNQITDVLSKSYDIWDIAISPSGRYLAYAGKDKGDWDIFVYDLETTKEQKITHSLGNEWDPSFGINDYELWFAGESGINGGIYYTSIQWE